MRWLPDKPKRVANTLHCETAMQGTGWLRYLLCARWRIARQTGRYVAGNSIIAVQPAGIPPARVAAEADGGEGGRLYSSSGATAFISPLQLPVLSGFYRRAGPSTLRTGATMTLHPIESVRRYHERTKHHPQRYARALGYLDWANQPDPFRRFEGARLIALDEVPPAAQPAYAALFGSAAITPRPVDRAAISQLFYDSLALSAWKATGQARWSLRVNPSSGDLHPTEGYLIAGPIDGLSAHAGVFHYAPYEHALEERLRLPGALWQMLARGLPDGGLLVGLTSIYWREAWK